MEDWINKKVVFHIHTRFSHDSLNNPEDIIDNLYKNGIDVAVITDHNEIKGALIAQQYAQVKYKNKISVIVGEEVVTDIGDLIVFPITTRIESYKIQEVLDTAKSQNAFVCLPHPYESHDLFKIHTQEFVNSIDFVEIVNSRVSVLKNGYAKEYATHFNKKIIVGVDAHLISELQNNSNFFINDNENEYKINKFSSKRNKRISQLISNLKKKKLIKIFKYLILSIFNL